MNRRVKKKGKRKIKLWVKLAFVLLILSIIGGLIGYGWYQKKLHEEDPAGTIHAPQGTITQIETEKPVEAPLEYAVLPLATECIFIDYGDLEILINAPRGVFAEIKDKVNGPLEYLVFTSSDAVKSDGLDELKSLAVSHAIGRAVEGAESLSSGGTIILGNKFSLTTIESTSGLATYLTYKDCGFLSLGDLTPDEEHKIKSSFGACDVIVAAQGGKSENNRIIKANSPRYVVVSQKNVLEIGSDLFGAVNKAPIYATGKTGKLLFSTTGSVVTAAFDVKDYITLDLLESLKKAEETAKTEENSKNEDKKDPETAENSE